MFINSYSPDPKSIFKISQSRRISAEKSTNSSIEAASGDLVVPLRPSQVKMKPHGIKRDVSLTSQDWKDINIETFRNKLDSFEAFAKEFESEKQKQEEGPVRRQSSGALVNDESRVTRDISSKGLNVLDPDIRKSKSIYQQRHESLHVSTAFAPYLPAILRQQLLSSNTATHLPTFQSVLGTVLIADISGFTKLGEKLRKKYGEGEFLGGLRFSITVVSAL